MFRRKKGLEPIFPGSKPVLSLARGGAKLLNLDLCASLFEGSLKLLGLCLGDFPLNSLGGLRWSG